jgi:D-alanine-D-alanine ligase
MHEQLISDARKTLAQKRILLVAGGRSTERPSSLTTRDAILPFLRAMCLSVETIDIHDTPSLLNAISRNDFVLNVIYGKDGEDGTMQGFLEMLRAKYFGPDVLPSSIGMNKDVFTATLAGWGYSVPRGCLAADLAESAFQDAATISFVLKPIDEGDSLGVQLLPNWAAACRAIDHIPYSDLYRWRLEEYISGRSSTIALCRVGGTLLVGDAIGFELPDGHQIYDTDLKLHLSSQSAKSIVLPSNRRNKIVEDVCKLYDRFRCKGLVRFDFMETGEAHYFIEMNTIPGFYPDSNAAISFDRMFTFPDLLALTIAEQC